MSTTCLEYRAFQRREAREPRKLEDYWKSSKGIIRRVDSLVQVFNYRIVNNAFKVLAPTNGAQWMRWRDM